MTYELGVAGCVTGSELQLKGIHKPVKGYELSGPGVPGSPG